VASRLEAVGRLAGDEVDGLMAQLGLTGATGASSNGR